MDDELVLELAGVSRQFGAVRALTNVSFDCRAGEVHALVGENGSGKSTLLGIASGFVDPDRGIVRIGGKPLTRDSPALSRKLGLAMAYQDGSSVQAEPVKNNLFYAAASGRPPYWRRKKWARQVLAEFDLDLELFPDAPVATLTMAERQLFEVAKALVNEPKVLLLDEPTTALGPDEVDALHRTVLACKRRGDRRGLRQPSAARSARGCRPDHGASRRATPRNLRRRDDDRTAARRTHRRTPVRGGVSGTRLVVVRSQSKCSSSMHCKVSRSARSASRCTAVRSWGSPGPRATASRNSSTPSQGGFLPAPAGSSAAARS